MLENKRKQIKMFEQKNMELLDREVAARKEQERALVAHIEDKIAVIRTDIAKEAAIREDDTESLKACLEVMRISKSNRMIFQNCKRH
jgi:hypothetical protein